MKPKGPQFLEYMSPMIEVLKANGGSGNTSEIVDKIIEFLNIPEAVVSETLPSGESRVRNRIQWARFYLGKAGMINTQRRGFWELTQEAYETAFDEETVYSIFSGVHREFNKKAEKVTTAESEDEIVDDEEHSIPLINILQKLKAEGFERICKRLLTEIGIHDIEITGKAGDQGIDGKGLIKINDVVNFNIIFQCKRYKETISPHHVRDFRGAMQGRADKGLIITTGRFTSEAKKEANRDGVPAIELIDGERLVALFEKYELGLKPVTVYQIVPEFFKNYQ